MARRVVETSFNGPAQRRIDSALQQAKAARADGVVVFCHWGCKQTLGLSQLAKQTMEANGLPTLVLDGDGCDARNVADGQMITRVNAFLEQLEGFRT
jgi:benzoyl-CoA reductase/2-hydroxyglutaryl-CoA dehydratase subunit BcrC/BadD/HgdB